MSLRPFPASAAALAAALACASCASTDRSAPAAAALARTAPVAAVPPSSRPEAVASARIELVPRGKGLPTRSQWREGFAVADLNGDGPVDVVFGPPRKGAKRPGVFVGDGLGAFRFWAEAVFPKLGYDYGAATTGDWNGDGLLDVAFAVHLRGLTALIQEPGGRFAPYSDGLVLLPPEAPVADALFSSRALVTADWNGDGRPDLVALGEGPGRGETSDAASAARRGLRVFLNRLGEWETVLPPVPEEEFGDALAVGDVTGDGKPDAVVTSSLLGSKRILRRGSGKGWSAEEIAPIRPEAYVTAVAIGRFDRDAVADVAVAWLSIAGGAWASGIDLLFARPGTAHGFEARTVWSRAERLRITSLAAGDLDGDSWNDLVALDEAGTIQAFLGDGMGFLTRDASVPAPQARAGCSGASILLRDVDGDGTDDAVAAFAGERDAMGAAGGRAGCPSGGAIEVWSARPR